MNTTRRIPLHFAIATILPLAIAFLAPSIRANEEPAQLGFSDIELAPTSTASTSTTPAPAPIPATTTHATGTASETLTFEPAPDEPAPPPATTGNAPQSDIVELPRYTVMGERILPPPEFWRHTTLPGYEILSNASERNTKNFLKDFQQFQASIRIIWPTLINHKATIPTLIIICDRANSFQQFIPASRAPDIFITPTSLFVEDKERGAIILDFGMQDVLDAGGFFTSNDPYQQFYRQYSRFLMRRANNNRPIPPWLEEGLSRIFTTLDFTKKFIEFGKIDGNFGGGGSDVSDYFQSDDANMPDAFDPDADPADPQANSNDLASNINKATGAKPRGNRFGYLSPLGQVFNPDPQNPPQNWSKECYAFVHMCLYGYNKKYQKAFLDFAGRASAGPVDEADFVECFGRTYKQMGMALRGYVEYPDHQSMLYQAKRGATILPDPKPVELRDATQAEIGRIKGEALRLAGHNDESRQALIVPYLRKEHDAGLLAALGLLESLDGRTERARKFLEAAAKDKVIRPRAYVALARLRLAEALAHPAAPDGKLSAAQTSAILDPLFAARIQPPSMEDVYSLIGDTWLASSASPKPANLEIMLEGTALFPKSPEVIYRAANLYAQYGSPDTAALLIKLGLKISHDPETQQKFETLQLMLPPPAPPPEQPVTPSTN